MTEIEGALNEILTFCENYRELHSLLIKYLDEPASNAQNLQNLIAQINKQKIAEDPLDLDDFLRMLAHISTHHHRNSDFFAKIVNLIKELKTPIQQQYQNEELFSIFAHCEPIVVLLKDDLIKFDEEINNIIKSKDNQDLFNYFYPADKTNELENQKEGENHKPIYKLMRDDKAEFISHLNSNNIPPESKVDPSPFETNEFLLSQKETNLLQYAAFFGSIGAFQYLVQQKPDLLEEKVWDYAIQGRNYEIINILKEKSVSAPDDNFKSCLIHTISSHHLELVNFIQDELSNPPETPEKNTEEEEEERNDQNDENVNRKVLDSLLKAAVLSHNYTEIASILSTVRDGENGITSVFLKSPLYSNIQEQGINELFQAASRAGFNKLVQILLKLPCVNINYCNKHTAFQKACRSGNICLVKLLLDVPNIDINRKSIPHVADLNKDFDGLPALGIAVRYGHNSIVRLLLSQPNILVNQKSQWIANTPLNTAAIYGNTEAAKLLLDCKDISIDSQSNAKFSIQQNKVIDGEFTALHNAAAFNHPQIVKLLLDKNANTELLDFDNRKAADLTDNEEIKNLFANH